jgi:hypothetical protein
MLGLLIDVIDFAEYLTCRLQYLVSDASDIALQQMLKAADLKLTARPLYFSTLDCLPTSIAQR